VATVRRVQLSQPLKLTRKMTKDPLIIMFVEWSHAIKECIPCASWWFLSVQAKYFRATFTLNIIMIMICPLLHNPKTFPQLQLEFAKKITLLSDHFWLMWINAYLIIYFSLQHKQVLAEIISPSSEQMMKG